jgi:cytochrome c-type biogenesis protein CcmH
MIVFYAMASALTLVVVIWLGRVLLRPVSGSGVSSQLLNAAIYRDQLQALERDRAGGGISAADFETTCDELQLRLLDETQNANPVSTVSPKVFWTPRKTVAVMGVLIPLSAAGLYAWLGTPSAIVRAEAPTQAVSNPQVLKMVETLAERLKANPDNPKGWAMLARSYKVLGRFDEAEQAYLKAGDIVNSDPNLLVDYADLLAVRANSIDGRPLELVNKALQLDPLQPTALMMSGVAAYHRGDYALAIRQWETLRTQLDEGSTDAQQVDADIAQAKTKIASGAPSKP